jgi:hypothetical protein
MPLDRPTRRPPDTPTPPKSAPRNRNDEQYLTYLRNLFLSAKKEKATRLEGWNRNYKIVNNRYQSAVFASWAPQPRDSEVYPHLSSLVAWLTDQEPDIAFFPSADPTSPYYSTILSTADDLTSVYITNWIVEEYDRHMKLVLWDGLMFGTGIVKTLWDNAAGSGSGNAVLKRVDPYDFYPDPTASCLDDCEYMVEVREMSYSKIRRMYPNTAFLLISGSSENEPSRPKIYGQSVLPRANLGFLPSGTGNWSGKPKDSRPTPDSMYTVYEYWIKENVEDEVDLDEQSPGDNAYATPRWKCVVTCAGNILFEEWADDLWSHGNHPYDDWRFDDIGEFWGISLVDHLSLPQLYINRLLTAVQQNSELCGNPIFVEPSNSGTQRTNITNRPGERVTVNSATAQSANLPRWLTPPSMPAMVMDMIQFWISRIENTAGINGMQKGKDPQQRVSENTTSSIQEAAFVRIRSALSNLGWTYRRTATKVASLVAQNYTDNRIMAILGPEGESTALSLRPFHFYDPTADSSTPLDFIIRAESGSNKPTSRNARVAEAEKMFALGIVDDQFVLQERGTKDWDKILKRLYMKRQQGLIGDGPGKRQRSNRK